MSIEAFHGKESIQSYYKFNRSKRKKSESNSILKKVVIFGGYHFIWMHRYRCALETFNDRQQSIRFIHFVPYGQGLQPLGGPP